MMDLSVVIPSAGKWPRLDRTLRSLAAAGPMPSSLEVVLVLDGVQLPSGFLAYGLPLRVVQLPRRSGRGAARNAGLRGARGEIAVLLDDDIVTSPGFLSAHLTKQSQGPALCSGPIRELPILTHVDSFVPFKLNDELSPRAAERIERFAMEVVNALSDPDDCWTRFGNMSRLESDGRAALRAGRHAVSWIAFAGANLSAPRRWWIEAPFDERPATRWGLEDLGRALAFALAGRPLVEAPAAKGLHLTHPRGQWKVDLEQTACCIDFIPERCSKAIVRYLHGSTDIDTLEAELLGIFSQLESRVAC